MSVTMVQRKLESYHCISAMEEDHALREIPARHPAEGNIASNGENMLLKIHSCNSCGVALFLSRSALACKSTI
jgi:hypothetical protein